MNQRPISIGLLFVFLALAVWTAAEEPPFPGRYMLIGNAAELLRGETLLVEDFLSPVCPQCYLYWKNHKALGADVQEKTIFVFQPDHGERPVRLMLIAREQGAEAEAKTLKALFEARFEQQVNTDDEDVLDALAESLGLGAVWKAKKNSAELDRKMKELAKMLAERGVERTPRIVVQHVLALSPGICACTGDQLPDMLLEVLRNLRQYRQAHRP